MTDTTLSEDLLALRDLKAKRDTATASAKQLDVDYKKEQRRLMDRMEAEGASGHKADNTTFTPVTKEYGTVQDRSVFVTWALEHEPELVEYKERGEQLNALVRQRLDDGEELPPGIWFYEREYISMRNA